MQSEGEATAKRIEVSVEGQLLRIFEGADEVCAYPISTSKFGTGSEEGSYRTPLGQFIIDEKIGDGAPEGTIFRSRKPEGHWSPDAPECEDLGDLVLSRVLWLSGLEEQNANTKERYIYIHGTNHEHLLGTPESMGCVRMANADVIELFDRIDVGTAMSIE